MSNVSRLNKPFRYRRTIKAEEIWAEPEASDEMVWAMCDYVRSCNPTHEVCQRCPKWHRDETHDVCMKGCYAMAEEAARVAMVALKKFPPPKPDVSAGEAVKLIDPEGIID